jgi:hypothetical protein
LIRSYSKRSGRGVDSSRSKAALQLYIKEQDKKSDSGIEEDRDLDSDDAIELMGMNVQKIYLDIKY